MDDFAKLKYVQEVGLQCRLAMNAVAHAASLLAALHGDDPSISASALQVEVFRALHSFLTHASNVSRLLWPPKPLRRKGEPTDEYQRRKQRGLDRGELLRGMLTIPDGHSLKSRELRDHLEHFDERLDDWQDTTERRALLDWNIGPTIVSGVSDRNRLRNFDPGPALFTFRGETYDIKGLAEAVADLLKKVQAADVAQRADAAG